MLFCSSDHMKQCSEYSNSFLVTIIEAVWECSYQHTSVQGNNCNLDIYFSTT